MANIFDNYGMDYTASCNNSLRAAKERTNEYVDLPEGKYQCKTTGVWLRPSKKYQDELQFKIGFQVLEGEYKGCYASKFYAVIPDQMELLKNDLNVLGVQLNDDIRTLGEEDVLNGLNNLIVDITVKHKKAQKNSKIDHFTNIYINRLVGMMGPENEPMEEVDDDDNPFE